MTTATTTTHAPAAIEPLATTSTEDLEAIWLDFHTKDAAADFLVFGYAAVAGLIMGLGTSHRDRSIATSTLIIAAKGRIVDLTLERFEEFMGERIASYQDVVKRPMRDDEIALLRDAVGQAAVTRRRLRDAPRVGLFPSTHTARE